MLLPFHRVNGHILSFQSSIQYPYISSVPPLPSLSVPLPLTYSLISFDADTRLGQLEDKEATVTVNMSILRASEVSLGSMYQVIGELESNLVCL